MNSDRNKKLAENKSKLHHKSDGKLRGEDLNSQSKSEAIEAKNKSESLQG